MFKKGKKSAEATPQIATSHPLFDFAVIDPKMRDAVRDYSSIKAYAAVQKKEGAIQPVKVIAPPVEVPKPVPVAPVVAPKSKKPLISRFVLLSGVFVLLATLLGGGMLILNLRQNEPAQVVTLPPVTTPPVTTPPVAQPPADRGEEQGKDTDSDGLTDAEERLFSTDIRNPDTDEDTYLDGNEVFHGYDPTIPSPASLATSALAKEYAYTGIPKFRFLKLNQWSAEVPTIVTEGSEGSMRLLTTSGSEFRIQLQARDPQQTLGDWYDASPSWKEKYGLASTLQSFVSKQGYVGRMTEDKRVVFLDVGTHIAVFEYDLKTERTVEYAQIFQMMLNSFTVAP